MSSNHVETTPSPTNSIAAALLNTSLLISYFQKQKLAFHNQQALLGAPLKLFQELPRQCPVCTDPRKILLHLSKTNSLLL
jgi:hypothetical protein